MDTTFDTASGPARASEELDLAALVGAAGWNRLPVAVRRRFARGHATATYAGEMTLRCSAIGRLFAWAAGLLGGPLTAACGTAPAQVRVYPDARGGVTWERHLALGGRDKVIRSTKAACADGLVERTDGGIAMTLDVFEEGGALVFRSRSYFHALGGRRIPIPLALTPGVCRVEHRDLGGGRFRFSLSMVHPWWGCTFEQDGVFHDPQEAST